MDEIDTVRMERNASVGIRTAGPVFQVALNRTADLRELRPDLMVAPRQQIDLHQRITSTRPQGAVTQFRQFCIAPGRIERPRTVGFLVTQDIVAQLSLFGIGTALRKRPIGLFDLAPADHLVQAGEGFRRFWRK